MKFFPSNSFFLNHSWRMSIKEAPHILINIFNAPIPQTNNSFFPIDPSRLSKLLPRPQRPQGYVIQRSSIKTIPTIQPQLRSEYGNERYSQLFECWIKWNVGLKMDCYAYAIFNIHYIKLVIFSFKKVRLKTYLFNFTMFVCLNSSHH